MREQILEMLIEAYEQGYQHAMCGEHVGLDVMTEAKRLDNIFSNFSQRLADRLAGHNEQVLNNVRNSLAGKPDNDDPYF